LFARLASAGVKASRFINLYLNDEDIRFLKDLETPVKDGDKLSIILAIAGG
jgi:sulfur-carrier protein